MRDRNRKILSLLFSFLTILIIALISGTGLVKLIGSYILQLTKKPKKILSCLLSYINHLGTFAVNKTVTLFLLYGECSSKRCVMIFKSLELNKRTNSCIRVNTRELDRDPFINWSILYTTTNGLC